MIRTVSRSSQSAQYLPGFLPPPDAAETLTAAPNEWLSHFVAACAASLLPQRYLAPDQWAEKNIIFSRPGDPVQGPIDFNLSPFLRDPLRAWETNPGDGVRERITEELERVGFPNARQTRGIDLAVGNKVVQNS